MTAGVVLLALAAVAAFAATAAPDGTGSRAAAHVLPGLERTGTPLAQLGFVSLAGTGLIDRTAWADVDEDGVADRVEEALCGSATCAVPWADVDGDGVPDAVDVVVCGTAGCVDARVDADADQIPDFVGVLLCGEVGCSAGTLRGDVDGDGVENWVEALIAGDATGATGEEDLDGDGIADEAALMECLRPVGRLATTGAEAWWLLATACAAGGAGLVLRGWRDLRVERDGTWSEGVVA
ncbi:MAG: hypothetical protein IE923_10770 [Micrococcales bacterium]|nr:hypothetical protein [Micrococcales bacterium]